MVGADGLFTSIGFGEATVRLGAALILGMLMGYEREKHGRPAGLRTHGLVSMGSALFTMLSICMASDKHDPARIASNIVTGIGFLGAGTIMRHGSVVHGLTTAASVWTAAAIGVACGIGWYPTAVVASAMVIFTLAVLRPAALRLRPEEPTVTLVLSVVEGSDALPAVVEQLQRLQARVVRVHLEPSDNSGYQELAVTVVAPPHVGAEALAASVACVSNVAQVRFMGED